WTPPPSSARAASKRPGEASSPTLLTTATAPATAALFWGFRLHPLFAMDGTPRALALTSPKVDEKAVCLQLVARCQRQPGQMLILISDKNFRGVQFEADLAALDAKILRPRRKDEKGRGPHLAPIHQRIESIFWTAKDILGLERHGARTLHNLFVRMAMRSQHSPPPSPSTTNSDAHPVHRPATPRKPVAQLIYYYSWLR